MRVILTKLLGTDLTQQAEQHIGVQRALVSFIHDDGTVVVQVWLSQRLPEQDAVCHVLDHGFLWRAVLETDGIAHLKVKKKKRTKVCHEYNSL